MLASDCNIWSFVVILTLFYLILYLINTLNNNRLPLGPDLDQSSSCTVMNLAGDKIINSALLLIVSQYWFYCFFCMYIAILYDLYLFVWYDVYLYLFHTAWHLWLPCMLIRSLVSKAVNVWTPLNCKIDVAMSIQKGQHLLLTGLCTCIRYVILLMVYYYGCDFQYEKNMKKNYLALKKIVWVPVVVASCVHHLPAIPHYVKLCWLLY